MSEIPSAICDVDLKRLRIVCQNETCAVVPKPGWARRVLTCAEGVIALHTMTAVAHFANQRGTY